MGWKDMAGESGKEEQKQKPEIKKKIRDCRDGAHGSSRRYHVEADDYVNTLFTCYRWLERKRLYLLIIALFLIFPYQIPARALPFVRVW